MFYLGRVIENKNFGDNGTIEVIIPQQYRDVGMESIFGKNLKDLLNNVKDYTASKLGSNQKKTVSCYVASPMGNAYNTGMFQLPQINTTGLVAKVEDVHTFSGTQYIWLGGLYGCKMYGEKVILPNDDTISDDLAYEDKALIKEYKNEDRDARDTIKDSDYINKGAFVIKTKASKIHDKRNVKKEEVDFKVIKSDNTVVLNKDKIAVRHNNYNENNRTGFEQIVLNDNSLQLKRITGEVTKNENDKLSSKVFKEQTITINDNSINIEFRNEENSNRCTLNFDSEGNINIDCTGNMKLNATGDMELNADGKMELNAGQTFSMFANNKNVSLAKVLNDLYNEIHYLQTTGSPASQITAPGTVADVQISQNNTNTGII